MFINSINSCSKIEQLGLNRNINFGQTNPLKKDTFELSNENKKVIIKDIDGNDVEAKITSFESDSGLIGLYGNPRQEKKYRITVKGNQIGYMIVSNRKNSLYIDELYTKEHAYRKYKGAGTQLLKCAVLESIKRGYSGEITLQASHGSASPLIFYYKNNFTVPDSPRNAAIQYAIQNNNKIEDVLNGYKCTAIMKLDKEGAQALLEGKNLYKDNEIEKINEKIINDDYKLNSYLMQSPNKNKYYILVFEQNKYAQEAQMAVILDEKEDENNIKHFVISDFEEYGFVDEEHIDFAIETANKIAQEKNYDKTTILKNRNTKNIIKNTTLDLQIEDN